MFIFSAISVAPVALFVLPFATCWGEIGHRAVGYLAQMYLSDQGVPFVAALMQDDPDLHEGSDISDAALWPDQIRGQHEWAFTKAWHFIDAADDPPRKCGVNYKRDCDQHPGEGCVVRAIVNMTSRINDPQLSIHQHQQALKFLLHFIGDIHQPLHTEKEGRGGNDIDVRFGNRRENLHGIWDKDIIEKHVGVGGHDHDEDKQAAAEWARRLFDAAAVAGIDTYDECSDITQPENCAVDWANEANKWICDYVLKGDVESVECNRNERTRDCVDLAGEYAEGAAPIVDDLIGKAGRRLGAWLNALAAQRADLQDKWELLTLQDVYSERLEVGGL